MEKVFETENKEEIYKIKKKLSECFFESEIKESSNKYELFVDENIYDEVLVQINIKKKDIKQERKITNSNKKGTFLYIVEQYFQIKYYKVILISLVYSIIPEIILIYKLMKKIKDNGINIEILEILILPFILTFIISQVIFLSTRYYQFILEVKNLFKIRIQRENDYSKINYKIFNFITGVVLHIVFIIFVVISIL